MYQLIGSGDAGSLQRLGEYQKYYPEYSEGYVDLEMRSSVAADLTGWLAEKLEAVGVPRSAVKVEGRHVLIGFRTELAPLVLIAGAIAACIFLVALIIAWKLYKMAPAAALGITTGWIVLIVGGVLLVLYLIATRGRLGIGPVAIGGS